MKQPLTHNYFILPAEGGINDKYINKYKYLMVEVGRIP